MAITFRSVLAAARAILQNKTVTAGTSDITVQADSGYDGLGTVTVQPTPTETGSATPTTSAQTVTPSSGKHLSSVSVGAIPSQYVVPTNITPSNSSPVSLTSGSAYKPSANGYAISSYSNLTPSDSSPVQLANNTIYKTNGQGTAVEYLYNITPSATNPPGVSSGNNYHMLDSGNVIKGMAINGNGVTPSSSGQYFYSGWNRMTSSGYAYSSQMSKPIDYFDGLFATSSQATYTFSQALKECYVCTVRNGTSYSGTYTGSGTMTTYGTIGNYEIIYKITNVASGDKFKCPTLSFGSGTSRSIMFVLGIKA